MGSCLWYYAYHKMIADKMVFVGFFWWGGEATDKFWGTCPNPSWLHTCTTRLSVYVYVCEQIITSVTTRMLDAYIVVTIHMATTRARVSQVFNSAETPTTVLVRPSIAFRLCLCICQSVCLSAALFFKTYRNFQPHRAVLPVIARLSYRRKFYPVTQLRVLHNSAYFFLKNLFYCSSE